jgi:hypothetical protein
MPRVSIQQFRAALASRAEPGPLVRAYRALARRPEAGAAMVLSEWAAWPSATVPASA